MSHWNNKTNNLPSHYTLIDIEAAKSNSQRIVALRKSTGKGRKKANKKEKKEKAREAAAAPVENAAPIALKEQEASSFTTPEPEIEEIALIISGAQFKLENATPLVNKKEKKAAAAPVEIAAPIALKEQEASTTTITAVSLVIFPPPIFPSPPHLSLGK